MKRSSAAFAFGLIIFLILFSIASNEAFAKNNNLNSGAARPIFIKSGTFTPAEKIPLQAQGKISSMAQANKKSHLLIQIDHIPTEEERAALSEQGIVLLEYIPDYSWLASVKNSGLSAASQKQDVTFIGSLTIADKIDPYLLRFGAPDYTKNSDSTANYSVQFFKDAVKDEIETLLQNYDAAGVAPYSSRTWRVKISPEKLAQFADEDIVQWIEPIHPPLTTFNDGARSAAGVNTVQAFPYNLNGSGVVLAQWDEGYGGHVDYNSRRTIGDQGGSTSAHATHVAGTMLGDGSNSATRGGTAAQWRGMATNATYITFEWPNTEDELDNETNISIRDYDAVLSQNSFGYDTSVSCSYMGKYDSFAQRYDSLIYGNASVITGGKSLITVFSAGNERSNTSGCIGAVSEGGSDSDGYGSIPGQGQTAKNTITVGAVTKASAMTYYSSWGPMDDGRLKPEVVAPGNSITSTYTGDAYASADGTSMASPVVSGIIGLMMQDYRRTHNNESFKPATAKAILTHTATDLNNTGPDFTTGYGLVNATRAIDVIRNDNSTNRTDTIIEDDVTSTANKSYQILVQQGQPFLKLTLAWDDYPGSITASKELVNDLDLVVFAPNGSQAWPWTISNTTRNLNASRNQTDNINPLEQAYVETPPSGLWRVYVNATVAVGSRQNFSLVSTNAFNSSALLFNTTILNISANASQNISNVANISAIGIENYHINLTKFDINSTTMISANTSSISYNITAGQSFDVQFNCTPTEHNASGIYEAIYKANSSNDTIGTNLTVRCIVLANDPPLVTVLGYTNNTITTNATYAFTFIFTDADNATAVAALFFNGTARAFNTTAQNNTNTIIAPASAVSEGIYSVWVNVSDNISNMSSSRYQIIIDTTIPPNATNVAASSQGAGWINWSWSLPIDNTSGINHTEVYMNGSFKSNVSAPANYYNSTGLTLNSNYTLQVRPVDNAGNIGNWTNVTANTTLDTTAPTVSLTSPANGTSTSTAAQTLTCSAVDNYNLSNISLWVGSGTTWALDQTGSASGESASKSFSKTLSVGTYNWNCMANDTSANSAFGANRTITITSGDTTTTSSSGGGGGGGGAGSSSAISESKLIGSQPAGATVIVSFDKTASTYVDTISFTAAADLPSSAALQILKYESKPSAVPSEAGSKVFTYLDIKPVNFRPADIQNAELKFVVDKTWLAKNKISVHDILLREYKNSAWLDLPTKKYGETGEQYLYKSSIAGFSYFAIAAVQTISPAVSRENKTNLTAAVSVLNITEKKNTSNIFAALPSHGKMAFTLKQAFLIAGVVLLIFASLLIIKLRKLRKKTKKAEEKENEERNRKKSFYETFGTAE